MKTRFFRKFGLGIVLAALWVASDQSILFSDAQAQPAPPPPTTANAAAVPPDSVAPPPSILPNSPLAEVIKLTQAGVDESVILSYVTNSTGTFNLDSDKIIYLNDLGVPNNVVTAMMQHDQLWQQPVAAANPPPPPPPPPPPTEQPTTEPTEPPPPPEPPPAPESAPVTVNYFYSSLAPYGTWVNVSGYGRCWRPTTVVYNSGWQPYCDHGHWVYSDCGWYWASDYSWGVTFHYGRWFRIPNLGWCWWPDTAWGPSWVTWRYSNNYCGWAPLPPFAFYQPGVGFVYHGSGVSIGFSFGLTANCFTFVPTRNFCDPHPRHYRVGASDETRVFNQTTVINNYNFNSHNRTFVNNGIAVQNITAATRTPIHPVPVRTLAVSTRQPWRGGTVGQQYHGPGMTTGNPQQPGSDYNNRNHSMPNAVVPGQNQFAHPVNNPNPQPNQTGPMHGQTQTGIPGQTQVPHQGNDPNPQPNYNSSTPAQTPTGHYDNKHIASPRGQQFEQQTPHYSPQPNVPDTQPGKAEPSAPPSSPASQSPQYSQPSNGHGQSQSEQYQSGQYQNGQYQNGRGH